MKKLIILLAIYSASMIAQVGPQPLYFSNITITPTPGSCDVAVGKATATISVTAAGGQPAADGSYIYIVNGNTNQAIVAKTATFTALENEAVSVIVVDAGQNTLFVFGGTPVVMFKRSATTSVSMDVVSLPLGNNPGCFRLTVINPAGKATGTVNFTAQSVTQNESLTETILEQTLQAPPFTVTFPSLPAAFIIAEVAVADDCGSGGSSTFSFNFPFPQGFGNALNAYIFNKYCSCPLSSTAIVIHP